MFVVKIKYLSDISEVDKYVQSHRDFLDLHYKSGIFLASGPMKPRTGGIIIAYGTDKETLTKVLKEDPYHQAGIASHEIIEFTAVKCIDELKPIIRKNQDVDL